MEYIYGTFQNVSSYFFHVKDEACDDPKEITRCEYYIERAYRILSWKEPSSTWIAFLVLNLTFWLIVQLQLRIFGIVFVTILLAFITDFLFEKTHSVPLHSEHSDSIRKLCDECSNIATAFKTWRLQSPASFCIGMCFIFLALSFTAGNISGYMLFYLGILSSFFLPLLFTKIPPEHISMVKGIFYSLMSQEGVSLAEDELMPYITGKDFSIKDPELESLLTDKTADSVTNSLISGMSTMPSYLDADELPNEIDEEDLLPSKAGVSCTPGDISSDSDSEIHFDPTHFDGNTSSEDEKFFGRGLKFKEADAVDSSTKPTEGAPSDGTQTAVQDSVLSRLVSTLMQTTDLVKPARKNSSSDSEFEIIEPNEIN